MQLTPEELSFQCPSDAGRWMRESSGGQWGVLIQKYPSLIPEDLLKSFHGTDLQAPLIWEVIARKVAILTICEALEQWEAENARNAFQFLWFEEDEINAIARYNPSECGKLRAIFLAQIQSIVK